MRLKNTLIISIAVMFTLVAVLVYAGITPSNIDLHTPEDNIIDWDGGLRDFNCSYSGSQPYNISFWHNFSGNWEKNRTIFDQTDALQKNFTVNLSQLSDFTDGNWTCSVNVTNDENFSDTSRTFSLDTTSPTPFNITNVTVEGGVTSGNNTITSDRSPTFIWNQTTEYHFANYTFQIATAPTFGAAVYYEKKVIGVTNTSLNLSAEGAPSLTADTVFYWRVIAYENSDSGRNPVYSSVNYTFTTDNTAPVVTLTLPINNTWSSASSVTFNYTPTDTNSVDACTLYGSFNGTWLANETDPTPTSGSNNNFTISLPDRASSVWNVWCNDSAGNSAFNATNYTISVDTTPPVITINAPVALYNSSSNTPLINITFYDATRGLVNTSINVTVNGSVYYISTNITDCSIGVNDTTSTTCTFNANALPDGTIEINATAEDGFGYKQNSSRLITIDTTNPFVSLTAPANNTWSSASSVTFNYTPSDTNLQACTLYGSFNGTWLANETNSSINNGAWDIFTINLPDRASSVWNVWCNDSAGNSAFNATNYTISVDTTPPVITINAPVALYNSSSNTPLINITFYDATRGLVNTSINVTVNGSVYYISTNITDCSIGVNDTTSTTCTFNANALPDGTIEINATAEDGFGYKQNSSRLITIDTTNPIVGINAPSNNSWTTNTWMEFNYTPTDSYLKNCTLYGDFSGSWGSNESNTTLNTGAFDLINISLSEGFYTWNVECYDHSGRSASNNTNWSFGVDSSTPGVNFTSPTSMQNLSSTTPTIQIKFTDNVGINTGVNDTINITINNTNGATSTYRINVNTTELTCDSSEERDTSVNCELSSITLPQGINNITISVVDTSGNNLNSTESLLFVADTTNPSVQLDAPADNTWSTSASVDFTYTPTDTYLKNCTLYGNFSGSWTNKSINTSVTTDVQDIIAVTLANGTYIWNVECFDYSGNSAYNATNYTVKVDTTAPTITSATSGTTSSNQQITFVINDSASLGYINITTISVTPWNTSTPTNFNNATDCISTDNYRTVTCTYTETSLIAGTNYLNITVKDNATNTAETYRLNVTTAGANNFTLSLSSGWNLVSTPLILTDSTIDTVVANNSYIEKIFYYDGASGWKIWYQNASFTDTLTTMEPLKGYWINSTAATTINLFGDYKVGGNTPYTTNNPLTLTGAYWYTIGAYDSAGSDDISTSTQLGSLMVSGCSSATSLGCYNFDTLIYGSSLTHANANSFATDAIWDRGMGAWIYMTASDVYR